MKKLLTLVIVLIALNFISAQSPVMFMVVFLPESNNVKDSKTGILIDNYEIYVEINVVGYSNSGSRLFAKCENGVLKYEKSWTHPAFEDSPSYSLDFFHAQFNYPMKIVTWAKEKIFALGYYEKYVDLILSYSNEPPQLHFQFEPVYLDKKEDPMNVNVSQNTEVNVDLKNNFRNSDSDLKTYSLSEIASILSVSESDVSLLIRKKELKAKKIGEKYIITKKSLTEYLNK
jgi:excisionase family DNA binding protein